MGCFGGTPQKTCLKKLNQLTTAQGEAQTMTLENPVYYSGHAPLRSLGTIFRDAVGMGGGAFLRSQKEPRVPVLGATAASSGAG